MAEFDFMSLSFATLRIKPDWKEARLVSMSRGRARLGNFKWVHLLVCIGLLAALADAQRTSVAPIAEAIRNRSDYSPVHLNENLRIAGIVTDEPHDVGSGNSLGNLQDATGGIAIFGEHKLLPPGRFKRGDVLEVRGKVSQYRGMEELLVEEVHQTGTAKEPPPREVLAAELQGEDHSGRLVQVSGQLSSQRSRGVL